MTVDAAIRRRHIPPQNHRSSSLHKDALSSSTVYPRAGQTIPLYSCFSLAQERSIILFGADRSNLLSLILFP
ncbi:hypothetical protein SDJN03_12736, partial [Cucurbita argyrosperma subsp. sororia]